MLTTKTGPVEFGRAVQKWFREYDAPAVLERVQEAFWGGPDNAPPVINPKTVPLMALAQGLIGEDWAGALKRLPVTQRGWVSNVKEAREATDASAFSNITGQLLIRTLQEGYDAPNFIGDQLMDTINEPMTEAILGELKIPGITGVTNGPSLVQQGMPYPNVGIKEDWITLPKIEKWGYILPITLEAVAQDRTGQIQKAATNLGNRLRIDKEERMLLPVLGIENTFKWQDVTYATYGTGVGPTGMTYTNAKTGVSVALKTWELLNDQIQLFVQTVDPFTGKPINIDYNDMQILYMPESAGSFFNVVNATTVTTSGANTAAFTAMTGGRNMFGGKFNLLTSPYARNLLTSTNPNGTTWTAVSASNVKDYWYLGNFRKAFAYRSWIPFETMTAPPLNQDEWDKDIIFNVKAREAGKAGVINPRYTSFSKNA